MEPADSSIPDYAQCGTCRYPLRGLPNSVCPECGEAFDPLNPVTWHDPTIPGFLARQQRFWRKQLILSARSPRTWEILVIAGLTGMILLDSWSDRVDESRLFPKLFKNKMLEYFVLIWFFRISAVLVANRIEPSAHLQRGKDRVRWLSEPICLILVCLSLLWASQPWSIQLRLSTPALEQKARLMRQTGGVERGPQFFGAVTVNRIAVLGDNRVKFEIGRSALIYDPDHLRGPAYASVPGDWYFIKRYE